MAIPPKHLDRAIVSFLTKEESDALIGAPDLSARIGRRDHTLLAGAVQTGLRVSELTGLRLHDDQLGAGPHVRCIGQEHGTDKSTAQPRARQGEGFPARRDPGRE